MRNLKFYLAYHSCNSSDLPNEQFIDRSTQQMRRSGQSYTFAACDRKAGGCRLSRRASPSSTKGSITDDVPGVQNFDVGSFDLAQISTQNPKFISRDFSTHERDKERRWLPNSLQKRAQKPLFYNS